MFTNLKYPSKKPRLLPSGSAVFIEKSGPKLEWLLEMLVKTNVYFTIAKN